MIPQLIYLSFIFIGIGLEAARHGKQKDGKHNFYTHFLASVIALILLYLGGFFDPMMINYRQ